MSDYTEMLIASGVLVLAAIVLRTLAGRLIHRGVPSVDLRRRWLVQTRNGLILLVLIGLILIWGEPLRALALSILAAAIAFVVATKELISCVTGSLFRASTRAFSIGHRIQIKDFRGEVIDQNLLATTIMEIGPGKMTHQRTGRVIVIPNALFLSEPVINESYTHDYVLHVFTVPFKRDDDWRAAQRALLAAAQKVCQPYLEEVREYMARISERKGLDAPNVEPRVTLSTPAAGEIHLVVRVPARAGQSGFVEQSILAEAFASENYTGK